MRAYSLDLRERVVADCDAGMRPTDVAEKYRVSGRWVYQLLARRRESGEIAPRRGRTGPKPRLTEHLDRLGLMVQQHPDATLRQLRELLCVPVGLATLWRALQTLGITLKKSPACR
jgi:transposase